MGLPKLFFDNRFADAVPVASTTAAGNFAAANIADMRPYTWHKPTALPATMRVNCGSAKAADYALVHGHNLFTHGATFEVRGSTDNFATSDVLVATKTPTDNKPFLIEFASASYQYWGYRITGTTMPSIAIAMIGAAFEMPHHLPVGFDPNMRQVVQQANNNDNGWPLGTIIQFEKWKQTLKFVVLQSWVRSAWEPAWDSHLRGSPCIFAWDSANYPMELQYGKCGDGYQAPHRAGLYADLSFEFGGVAR